MNRYAVDNQQGVRQEMTAEEFQRLTGTPETRRYVFYVYTGRMALADVPEALREAVKQTVAARTVFSGPYQLPAAQTLEILTGGAAT